MKWLQSLKKAKFRRRWRFKKVSYLFTEVDLKAPLFIGIYFIETADYYFQSLN